MVNEGSLSDILLATSLNVPRLTAVKRQRERNLSFTISLLNSDTSTL